MIRVLFLVMFSFAGIITINAQSQNDRLAEIEMQQVALRQRLLGQALDSAIYFMDNGKYALAENRLTYILENSGSVSSDVVFYFGKNSYYLNKYSQSSDWLNKYIQLKGTSGQYYAETISLLKKGEEELLNQTKSASIGPREVLSRDYDIDCGPSGKVTCPICKGTTVIIKKGYIESSYKTCQFCDSHGLLSCEDYNKLIRGQLQPVR